MQSISITKERDQGGIDPDQVFWVKEDIITKEDLRQSVDEEQIADILGAMLLSPIPPSNVSVLDEYYGYRGSDGASRYQKIEEALAAVSPEKVSEQFFCIFDELKRIFRERPKTIIAQTENAQYDFKQGIHTLANGKRNEALVLKIFKTLTAMANAGKGATGYVLLGVADNFDDAETIRATYKTESISVGSFYITGVNGEVDRYYNNYDTYLMTIKNILDTAPISEHYRRQIGAKMRMVNYHGKAVVILRISCDNGPVVYDNAYYTRTAASNDPAPVSAEAMPAFIKKFY